MQSICFMYDPRGLIITHHIRLPIDWGQCPTGLISHPIFPLLSDMNVTYQVSSRNGIKK